MNINEYATKAKTQAKRAESNAEELKKLAFVQFSALAKKNIRLPIENFHL